MNGFSANERKVARFFSKFPSLKLRIKQTYQYINYLLYKKKFAFQSVRQLNSLSISTGETFFGYYDKSPVSKNNRYILFHQADFKTTNLPHPKKPISIYAWDLRSDRVAYVSQSRAYNWQQGSRLQWLNDMQFIYNNYTEQLGYHAVKVELLENYTKQSVIPFPIYDCFGSQYGLSLSFERLHKLRPDYGYRNHSMNQQLLPNSKDGIFYIDLTTGDIRLLISLEQIIETGDLRVDKGAVHKVNHIMISPDGQTFMFLHRYLLGGRRFDRLIISGVDGAPLRVLADHEMVSHCCWLDDHHIVGYLRDFQLGDRYYKINIHSGQKTLLGEGIIDRFGDGHPSVYEDMMIFDTYPNKARMKELFQYDLTNNRLSRLGQFFESMAFYGETRCDLHPRLSGDGKYVFFDSVHEGKRKLFWIEL